MPNLPPARSFARFFIFPVGMALAGLFGVFCLLSSHSGPYARLGAGLATSNDRDLAAGLLLSLRCGPRNERPGASGAGRVSGLARQATQARAEADAGVFRARGNVRVMQANVRAGWGSMGLVQNELDGLAELVRAHDDWDYALAVSGDTYPLVSQERLVERLAYWRRRGANFVCDDGKKPQRNQHVQAHKSARLAKLAWPTGVTEPDQFGSQWFTLTREFVEYTLTSTFARNVLMAMAQVEIPDESFFQVLLMNSHFNNTVGLIPPAPTSQICRYITWDKCNYEKKGIHMWPCFFGPKDFAAMTASDCVFTRKLHPDVSGDLYDMLDQHMATAV